MRLVKIVIISVICSCFSMVGGAHENRKTEKKSLRVYFPHFHPEVIRSFAFALEHLGHTLVIAGPTCHPTNFNLGCRLSQQEADERWPQCNVKVLEKGELFKNPPDVVFAWGPVEAVNAFLYNIWPRLKKRNKRVKLAYFTGNDTDVDCAYHIPFIKNIVLTDSRGIVKISNSNVPNWMLWTPWIDFDHSLQFKGGSNSPSVGTYVGAYKERFPEEYQKCVDTSDSFNLQGEVPCSFFRYTWVPHDEVIEKMREHCATLHCRQEPFGYSIIESLSVGRPVFLYRPYSQAPLRRYLRWCIEGETAFYFSSQEEFNKKLELYLSDAELRNRMQLQCAETVREIINNHHEARRLQKFLDNLVDQPRKLP